MILIIRRTLVILSLIGGCIGVIMAVLWTGVGVRQVAQEDIIWFASRVMLPEEVPDRGSITCGEARFGEFIDIFEFPVLCTLPTSCGRPVEVLIRSSLITRSRIGPDRIEKMIVRVCASALKPEVEQRILIDQGG